MHGNPQQNIRTLREIREKHKMDNFNKAVALLSEKLPQKEARKMVIKIQEILNAEHDFLRIY
jgi:hypothetical protein